jgi:hypothetical protein
MASVEVLRHGGVDAAEVIVSTIPDELLKGTTNEQLVRQLRKLAPNAAIIANCTRISQVASLKAAGADHVFRAPTEVALGILPVVYAALNANLPSYLDALEEEHGALDQRAEVID